MEVVPLAMKSLMSADVVEDFVLQEVIKSKFHQDSIPQTPR